MASNPRGFKAGHQPATYQDILALPDYVNGEIVDGELFVSPRPGPKHTVASSTLGIDLGGPFQRGRGGPGGWWILDEPELHLGGDVLVPDLAGWRRERMPHTPASAWFDLAPDWVCEVLSPSTAILDRTRKLPVYARERVSWLWLIDPRNRTLEVLRLEGESWLVAGSYGGDQKAHLPPFDAIELELEALWDEESPPAAPEGTAP